MMKNIKKADKWIKNHEELVSLLGGIVSIVIFRIVGVI